MTAHARAVNSPRPTTSTIPPDPQLDHLQDTP
jgi:hypothetical protein